MKKLICLAIILLAITTQAQWQYPVTVDTAGVSAPPLRAFEGNATTFQVTIKKNGTNLNCAGYSPFMFWAVTETGSSMVTAACTWVTQTSGVFNAAFTGANLNTNGNLFIYGCGVQSNTISTVQHGSFKIVADPYATGAGALSFTNIILLTLPASTNGLASGTLYRSGTNLFIVQ